MHLAIYSYSSIYIILKYIIYGTKSEPCFEQTKHVVQAMIVLKGFGGVGFVLGSYAGAILLVINRVLKKVDRIFFQSQLFFNPSTGSELACFYTCIV